jgi:hypothetical protein
MHTVGAHFRKILNLAEHLTFEPEFLMLAGEFTYLTHHLCSAVTQLSLAVMKPSNQIAP